MGAKDVGRTDDGAEVPRILHAVEDDEEGHGLPLLEVVEELVQVGVGMLAALLDWPQAIAVSALALEDGWLHVRREVEGGTESLDVQLPAVVSADLRLNAPRFVKLPDLMKAKRLNPMEILGGHKCKDSAGIQKMVAKAREIEDRRRGLA